MLSWLRRSFITGFFVIVPLIISVAALVWIFRVVDGVASPLVARWLGHEVPGLGLVTSSVRTGWSTAVKSRLVRSVRYASATGDFGSKCVISRA